LPFSSSPNKSGQVSKTPNKKETIKMNSKWISRIAALILVMITLINTSIGYATNIDKSSQSTHRPQSIDCQGAQAGDTLSMLYSWVGAEESHYLQIIQPLATDCGIVFDTDHNFSDLDQRVQDGNPPDIVISNQAALANYRDQLIPLDTLGADHNNYEDLFIQLGNVDNQWFGLPVKMNLKSLIWYSPAAFLAGSYQVPTTWNELNSLVEKMKTDGKVPWSMGFESGGADGWAGSDFIQDILLVQQDSTYINNIIAGKVRYNDAGVKQAYQAYGKWAKDPLYTPGGAAGTISTNFFDAIDAVFSSPSTAMMVRQADFAGGVISNTHPGYVFGVDYDFFAVPGAHGVQGGADILMAFKDTPAVRALITYLTSLPGGANWAAEDFDLSPNKGAIGNYSDPIAEKENDILNHAAGFTPDLGDTIGGEFQTAEWQAIINYINGGDLDAALAAAEQGQPFYSTIYIPLIQH
jgi:alpha-glucoside transport system substrate-binding protein